MNSSRNNTSSLHVKVCDFFTISCTKFRKQASEVRKNPSEKKVHMLRITTRKIRNTLAVMEIRPESERLKHLAKTLGDIRDADVAISNSKKFNLKDKHILKLRKSYGKEVRKNLQKDKVKKQLKELNGYEVELRRGTDAELKHCVTNFRKELLTWKDRKLTLKNMHDFRKIMKKVRYFFEAVSMEIAGLDTLHECLGELHDLIVLTEISGRHTDIHKVILKEKKKVMLLSGAAIRLSLQALNKIKRI
jgi:CHAD domain-containing protein